LERLLVDAIDLVLKTRVSQVGWFSSADSAGDRPITVQGMDIGIGDKSTFTLALHWVPGS